MTIKNFRVKILIIYICSSCLSMLTTYYTRAFRILIIHSEYLRPYAESTGQSSRTILEVVHV